jgi:hypothetical protein
MTRWLLLAVCVVAISAAATFFVVSSPTDADRTRSTSPSTLTEGPPPLAVLDQDLEYHFDVMPLGASDSHVWTIMNEGKGDLLLKRGSVSCSCTVPEDFPTEAQPPKTVKPGESYKFKVKWTPKSVESFHKTVQILTNDPKHEQLLFEINGSVTPPIVVSPEDPVLDMAQVENDHERDFHLLMYSPDRPKMKILSATTSRPDLLEMIEEQLDEQEQAYLKQKKASGGHKFLVRVKPTSKLGVFHEELVVTTDHPLRPEVRQVVTGRIVGPVQVTPTSLRLNNINSAKGASVPATIMVVGQDQTHFEIEKTPKNVKVTIAPVDEKSKRPGAVKSRAYIMTVTVPPGTPPGIIQEPIVLKTDNPRAKELKVDVYFQVLGEF